MIECGIDGISRGIINQGVLIEQGKRLMDFIPLNINVVERSNNFGFGFKDDVHHIKLTS